MLVGISVYVYHMRALNAQKPQEGITFPETGIIGSFELLDTSAGN